MSNVMMILPNPTRPDPARPDPTCHALPHHAAPRRTMPCYASCATLCEKLQDLGPFFLIELLEDPLEHTRNECNGSLQHGSGASCRRLCRCSRTRARHRDGGRTEPRSARYARALAPLLLPARPFDPHLDPVGLCPGEVGVRHGLAGWARCAGADAAAWVRLAGGGSYGKGGGERVRILNRCALAQNGSAPLGAKEVGQDSQGWSEGKQAIVHSCIRNEAKLTIILGVT